MDIEKLKEIALEILHRQTILVNYPLFDGENMDDFYVSDMEGNEMPLEDFLSELAEELGAADE